MNEQSADILSTLIQSAEVRKNKEDEILRIAERERKIKVAMDRVSREWR